MCCEKKIPAIETVAKSKKALNHEDTKFFGACLSYAWQANKVFLCAFVSLWFKAFMLFATAPFAG